jgi:hypothetical protein
VIKFPQKDKRNYGSTKNVNVTGKQPARPRGRPKGSKNKPKRNPNRKNSRQKWNTPHTIGSVPPAYKGADRAYEVRTASELASRYERGAFPLAVSNYRKTGRIISAVADEFNISIRAEKLVWNNTGSATVAQDIVDGVELDRPPVDIKDIDNTNERGQFKAFVVRVMALQTALIAQGNIRAHCPAVVGDIDANDITTGNIWTSTDWLNILAVIVGTRIQIPQFLIEHITMLNPRIILEEPNPAKRHKGAMHMMWCPDLTASEARTLIGEIQIYQQGALSYMNKVGVKYTGIAVTLGPLVNFGEDTEYVKWINMNPVHQTNAANTGIIRHCRGEWNETTDSTWYEYVQMLYRTNRLPCPLYGLTRYVMGKYDATHNVRGCLVPIAVNEMRTSNPAGTASSFHAITAKYNDTAFQSMGETDANLSLLAGIYLNGFSHYATKTLVKTCEAGHTLNLNIQVLFANFWGETLSSSWFSEVNWWNWASKFSGGYSGSQAKEASKN